MTNILGNKKYIMKTATIAVSVFRFNTISENIACETEKNPYYKDTKQFVLDTKVPYLFKSDKFKQIEQAQRDFINAVLRRESGAVIGEQEFENARLQYFPQPGDTPKVVKQKQKNREMQFAKIEELKQRDPLGIL